MRILHLTDLHCTDPEFPSLNADFNGVKQHLGVRKFDFIVVSGDLSQRAGQAEYKELLTFAEGTLLPLLHKAERPRVIFVPGNHDVSWDAKVWQELSCGQVVEELKPKEYAELVKLGRDVEHRVQVDERGQLRFYKRLANYAERFDRVQQFFHDFYGGTMISPHRMLDLKGSDAESWSAHVFPEEGIAFGGFNSCCSNDRYWVGAMVHPDAVAAAGSYLEIQASGCVRVAVWHHGLASDDQRPDYLMPRHIGRVSEAGFAIGMHGHTHRDQLEQPRSFVQGRPFAVVATGSLGAGARERPGAVGNQFSVLDVLWPSVRVTTFERAGLGNVYIEKHRKVALALTEHHQTDITFVGRHQRDCVLDEKGIATVEVQLTDVEAKSPLVLALVVPPFCETAFDAHASTDAGNKKVTERRLPGGMRLYEVELPKNQKFSWLKWRYRVSNTLALDTDELEILPDQREHYVNAPAEFQVRPHACRFLAESLILTLTLPPGRELRDPEAFVEQNVSPPLNGHEQWERVSADEQKLKVTRINGTSWRLSIAAPVPGYRYGILHKPSLGAGKMTPAAFRWAERLLGMCRDGHRLMNGLLAYEHLSTPIASVLGEILGDLQGIGWFGLLIERNRSLVTAFGHFRVSRFAVGDGVAGHAVRIQQVSAWSKKHIDDLVLYKRAPISNAPLHSWVVCVPLLVGPGQAPVGAISLWAHENGATSNGASTIESMVDDLRTQSTTALSSQLLVRVNQMFWLACEEVKADITKDLGVSWELAF